MVGEIVTAAQKTGDGVSDSPQLSTTVIDVPNPLPSPVYDSDLVTCGSRVQFAGLIPGARVIMKINGADVVNTTVSQLREVVPLLPGTSLSSGTIAQLSQRIDGTGLTSPVVPSLKVEDAPSGRLLPAPLLAQPLVCGKSFIDFVNTVPGADLEVNNEGIIYSLLNVRSAYRGNFTPSLRSGKLTAKQTMSKCEKDGEAIVLTVAPAPPPGPPKIVSSVCSQIQLIGFEGLVPGAILTLIVRTIDPLTPTIYSEVVVGDYGISSESEDIPFDPSQLANPPVGKKNLLTAHMQLCNTVGPYATPVELYSGGPAPTPRFAEPLFECSRFLIIENATVGSQLQAFSSSSGQPISDPVIAKSKRPILRTYLPLQMGDKIKVEQRGCDANFDVGPEPVNDLPVPFPVPEIVAPVRPGATTVTTKNCVIGATLYLIVNGSKRTAIEVTAPTISISTGTAGLVEGDKLWAVQALCDRLSSLEGRPVEVNRGKLNVLVKPDPVTRGVTTAVTVNATDADTGQSVPGAKVILGGLSLGVTGSPFNLLANPGAGSPMTGVVQLPPTYFDAPFAVNLIDPPPVPKDWRLRLVIGPNPLTIGLTISEAKWKIQPLWGVSAINATGSTQTVTIPVPPPGTPASNQKVEVTLEATAFADTVINGILFRGSIVVQVGFPKPATVDFTGKNLLASWLALHQILYDANGIPNLVVSASLTGIVDD
jgi:hypothetical protein